MVQQYASLSVSCTCYVSYIAVYVKLWQAADICSVMSFLLCNCVAAGILCRTVSGEGCYVN